MPAREFGRGPKPTTGGGLTRQELPLPDQRWLALGTLVKVALLTPNRLGLLLALGQFVLQFLELVEVGQQILVWEAGQEIRGSAGIDTPNLIDDFVLAHVKALNARMSTPGGYSRP